MRWSAAILPLIPIHSLSGRFLCSELLRVSLSMVPSFVLWISQLWLDFIVRIQWLSGPYFLKFLAPWVGWCRQFVARKLPRLYPRLLWGLTGTPAHLYVSVWSLQESITPKDACKLYYQGRGNGSGTGYCTICCTFLGLCITCTCFYILYLASWCEQENRTQGYYSMTKIKFQDFSGFFTVFFFKTFAKSNSGLFQDFSGKFYCFFFKTYRKKSWLGHFWSFCVSKLFIRKISRQFFDKQQ